MAGRAPGRKAPSSRFSSTVSSGNRRRPSGTIATPSATISCGGLPVKSMRAPSSSSATEPREGRSSPMMHFISVLLPLPLVPSSATVSPWHTCSDTPCSTRTAP